MACGFFSRFTRGGDRSDFRWATLNPTKIVAPMASTTPNLARSTCQRSEEANAEPMGTQVSGVVKLELVPIDPIVYLYLS